MTSEVTTIIGQLNIKSGHQRKDRPNQVAVREPKSAEGPGAGKGDLFIVTEIQGNLADSDDLEQELAITIRDSYYLARGAVTASLRRAVQAGNDLLYQRNRQVGVEERVVGGVVVLAMCQDDAFVAQIGPAAFFAVLGDHIRRYPARSVWLDEAMGPAHDDEDASAMGLSKMIEPNLHHLRVEVEDMLVLADSRLAGQLPLSDLVQAVDVADIKSAVKNLGEVAQARHCSALILQVIETGSVASMGPIKVTKPANLGQLFHREPKGETAAEALPEVEAVAPEETKAVARGGSVFASTSMMQRPLQWLGNFTGRAEPVPAGQRPKKASPERKATPAAAAIDPAGATDAKESVDSLHAAPAAQYDDLGLEHDWEQEASPESGSIIQKVWGGLTTGLLFLIAWVGRSFSNTLGQVVGREGDSPRQAGMQAQQAPARSTWVLLRNIAIVIPLLVTIIVGVSYLQKGRLREAEYQEFVTLARNKFEQAQAVDVTTALGLMTEAESALIQAEQIKPNQPEILQIRQQMAETADQMTNVHRLYYLPQLRQYTDAGTQLSDIVVQGVELYVMDSGNDRIFHHTLDDSGETLLPDDETVLITARGQTVEDINVGELLGMTWMPTGGSRQTSDLVILNSTGLMEYNPNWGITTSVLAGGETLAMPTAVDSYFGNFYVLDSQANLLFRYLPTIDGYSQPPQNYFVTEPKPDLSQAVDMTIDGAIYILFKDGRISKFLGGQPASFEVTGLLRPFNNPVAIFSAPDEIVQHIYVADGGNQRIVQLNKDGSFVRQFKPRPGEAVSFANLQDIYVDEIGGKLYILDSNNLYAGNIPVE